MYCLVLSVHSLALNAFNNKSFSQGGLFSHVLLPPPTSLALSDLIFFFVNKIVSFGHDGYVLVQLPQGQNFY